MNHFIAADSAKCIGCRTCEIACALAKEPMNDIEKLSPTHFESRLHVVKTSQVSVPVTCHQCEDAPCLNACPSSAIFYDHHSVQVHQEACFGCKNCVVACPFGVMDLVTYVKHSAVAGMQIAIGTKSEAHKCDLCVNHPGGPACVAVCPTKALFVMDEEAIEQARKDRQRQSLVEGVRAGYGRSV